MRVRGYDRVHFASHLTTNLKTHTALSFVYSKLVRHKVGAEVQPGTFIVEPDLAERWEELDDTTYVFYLRQGVKGCSRCYLNPLIKVSIYNQWLIISSRQIGIVLNAS